MTKTDSLRGFGIDDGAGIHFLNGQAVETEGAQVIVLRKKNAIVGEGEADADRAID